MSLNADQLSPELLERVLAKLGFSDRPEPTMAGLRALYDAWCRKVPFDNVRKLIHVQSQDPGPLPGDDPPEFLEAWLKFGTGGTCWAGNGGLHALLVSLGFDASRGEGTMLITPNTPPNHGTVIVTLDGDRYVVDASILHVEPLRLDETANTGVENPAWGIQCSTREDGHWYIAWRPAHKPEGMDCRIERLQVNREVFHDRHEETRPWSPFNYELYARSVRGDSMVSTTGGRRVEFTGDGQLLQRPLTGDDRARFLIDELGMSEDLVRQLPADTPTPPPPWSKKARGLTTTVNPRGTV